MNKYLFYEALFLYSKNQDLISKPHTTLFQYLKNQELLAKPHTTLFQYSKNWFPSLIRIWWIQALYFSIIILFTVILKILMWLSLIEFSRLGDMGKPWYGFSLLLLVFILLIRSTADSFVYQRTCDLLHVFDRHFCFSSVVLILFISIFLIIWLSIFSKLVEIVRFLHLKWMRVP